MHAGRQQGTQGPAVLLVHGFGVGAFQWYPLMERLADEHQVWALDLLGQGLSWPSEQALAGDYLRRHTVSCMYPCWS